MNNIFIFVIIEMCISMHSYLVFSILGNISNPRQGLISTLFDDLQVTHLNSTYCEIRDFEFQLNWYFRIFLSRFIFNGRKAKLSAHQIFFASRELFDAPNHATLVWYILDRSHIALEDRTVNINWNRYDNFYVICDRFLFKLSSCFNYVFNS